MECVAGGGCTSDCVYGKCAEDSQECICFNGFSQDEQGKCTVEGNTYRLLVCCCV